MEIIVFQKGFEKRHPSFGLYYYHYKNIHYLDESPPL